MYNTQKLPSSGVSDIGMGTEPEATAHISREMTALHKELLGHLERMQSLEQRLHIVLRPPSPTTAQEHAKEINQAPSPLRSDLENFRVTLRQIELIYDDLFSRLEI